MTTAAKTWRFIDTGHLDGPNNMAVDEALLVSFNPADSQPVLRLYGWSPPAFSVGKFQNAGLTLDLDRCREAGIKVVRRVTAGGIIYHGAEVTYSIVCARHHIPEVGTVKGSFKKLCGFLLLTYRKLGLDPAFALDRRTDGIKLGERTALCFAGKEEFDIVIDGRKIGGNAQRRKRDLVFQHGSIPLRNSLGDALDFVHESARPSTLAEGTVSLEQLKVEPEVAELNELLAASFEQCFGVTLGRTGLSPVEQHAAAVFLDKKYSLDSWNREGREPLTSEIL
jgi:lipoyl(octanoyl) transferase